MQRISVIYAIIAVMFILTSCRGNYEATKAAYEKAMELVISNTENLYVKNLINIHKKELNDFCRVKNIKL